MELYPNYERLTPDEKAEVDALVAGSDERVGPGWDKHARTEYFASTLLELRGETPDIG